MYQLVNALLAMATPVHQVADLALEAHPTYK